MTKPQLTTDQLLKSGFEEVGCWELSDAQLHHRIKLPEKAGVYAFAVDEIVQYVGLASTSLRQRLGFYRKPAATQRTNVRLNEIIRAHLHKGSVVRILVAHPPDQQWMGLCIKGAEGLEAGLISEFDLSWNVRGASKTIRADTVSRSVESPTSRKAAERVYDVIKRRPGMTELEIAKALFGAGAVQQNVNQGCRSLVKRGLVQRFGGGGRGDPYTYRVVDK